jgi:hypothetical protein
VLPGSQEELLTAMSLEAAAEEVARTFQRRIGEIEKVAKLDFGALRTLDTARRTAAPLEATEEQPSNWCRLSRSNCERDRNAPAVAGPQAIALVLATLALSV